MKKLRFTEDQIRKILSSAGGRNTIHAICRKQRISKSTFYRWRSQLRAHDEASQTKRLLDLEMENGQLKRQVAELLLDYNALRVALVNEASSAC
ncbi:MAG TPA: transposase [Nitrospira sp.]|nr:transposase [Nitrospira sp.]